MNTRAFQWIGLTSCCALACSAALAQDKPSPPSPSATSQLPFTSQAKKVVVFIQTDCRVKKDPLTTSGPNATETQSWLGTGFLVFVPEPRIAPDRGFQYLVTNRHVVQPGIEDSKPCDVSGYSVRVTLKAPGNGQDPSPLQRLVDAPWVFPSDDSVDLAAMPLPLDENVYDFENISLNIVADPKADALSEGDPVLFTGLFVQYMGKTKMQPIVRSGSIAMLPDETIETTLKKPGHVYLAEVHSFGGNSGSPVFVDTGGLRKSQLGFSFKLLGVVAGEVFEAADFHLQVSTTYDGKVQANSGISMLVPGSEVKALLESPQLQKQRDDAVALAKKTLKK